jgi:hypothetical protein
MYYAANSFSGGFKVVNDVVRRTIAAAFRFESMTGADQESGGACATASLNVGAFISHKKRTRGIGRQCSRRVLDQAGLRLAACAAFLRQMRTDVNSIQHRVIGGEQFHHAPIDRVQNFWRAFPAAYCRLIADHHHRNAEPIQHSNTLGSTGQQLHAFNRGQVVPLDVYRPIAIEKDGQAWRAST